MCAIQKHCPQRFLYETLTITGRYHIDDLHTKYQHWARLHGETQLSNTKNFRIHAEELGLKINRIMIDGVHMFE